MTWFVIASVALAGSASPLAEAERSASDGRFDLVLTQVERALATPLTDTQRRRAWELEAIAASAFDDANRAVDAFRHVLGITPEAPADPEWSPKLRASFSRAKELGPLPPVPAPTAHATDSPVLERPVSITRLPAATVPPRANLWQTVGLGVEVGGVFALGLGTGFGITSQSDRARLLALSHDANANVTGITRQQALAMDSQRVNDAALANAMWITGAILVASGLAVLWKGSDLDQRAAP